jgi:two-component system, chemotaxis family, response regulator Rcp1
MNTGPPRAFRILLVEDNAADTHLLRLALAKTGLTIHLTVIEDGAEALAFARREGKYATTPIPDLALLDLNLPKVSGVAVLEAMRQNQNLSHVPVAVITSWAAPRDRMKVIELGIRCYITKPSTLEELMHVGEVVKELLLESNGPTPASSPNGGRNVVTQDCSSALSVPNFGQSSPFAL